MCIVEVLLVKKMLLSVIIAMFTLHAVSPSQAIAGGHAFNLNLSINSWNGGYGYHRPPYYGPYGGYRGFRPVCPPGYLSRGCFAPWRKAGFALGVAGWRVGRAAFWAGRVAWAPIRATGRFLFGRRYW